MPDRKADSTVDAIKRFMGDIKIERFYSDRSGEIERALRDLHYYLTPVNQGYHRTTQLLNALFKTYSKGPVHLY